MHACVVCAIEPFLAGMVGGMLGFDSLGGIAESGGALPLAAGVCGVHDADGRADARPAGCAL